MADTNPSGPPKKAPFFLLHPAKWFAYRRSIPVEQRSYTKVYGVLSIMLFAFTVWAVLDEVVTRRPWKDIQADFKEFKIERLRLEMSKERAKIPAAVRKTVNKNVSDAKRAMNTEAYAATMEEIEELDIEIADVQRDYTFAKSESDEIYYHLDEARTHREDTTSTAEHYREVMKEVEERQAEVNKLMAKRAALVAKIAPAQDRLKQAENTRDSVFAGVIAIQRKIEATEAMTVQVKQTVLLNYEKTNFNNLKMRVDRCESCHLSYADPLFRNDTLVSTDEGAIKAWVRKNKYNDAEHYTIKKLGAKKDTVVAIVSALYRIHPNVDLNIKTHRVGEPAGPGVLGCTSCHGGQGPSIVSTEFAHGFEKHWTEPLLTGAYAQTSCQSCHNGKVDFEGAEWISMGKKLFTDFGCYGCHQMPGYEDLPTQAPSLLNISKKVTPEWMFQWIKNPRGWEHGTRMPNFLLSDKQAEQVTAYLMDVSKDSKYTPAARSGGGGNPLAGKQLFFDVGCVSCHAIDEWKGSDVRVKEGPNFGPSLQKIGSKVTAEWLFDWIKNPKNYNVHSRMPSLRLTDGEAADITAYLMQHTGANDSVKTSFKGNIADGASIQAGMKIIRDAGCYGCHEIKGMENQAKVAVSLATFGGKTKYDLFFGNQPDEVFAKYRGEFKKAGIPLPRVEEHAAYENRDWFTWVIGKMKHSRMYTTERIPQAMPNFDMSNKEAYAMSVFLRSQTGKFIGNGYVNPESQQATLDKGRMFVHWNNCVGCHKVENSGGLIAKLVNERFAGDQNIAYYAPPHLTPEGSRVQEDWLHTFLSGPFNIRPLVKFRMPSYGFSDEQLQTASNYFLATHDRQYVRTTYTHTPNPALLPAGKYLFDKLKCLSCHYVGGAVNAETKAPSLSTIKKRLRPDWLPHWLLRPDSVMPGTPMTAFWWASGKPAPADTILGGDYKLQIQAVIDYVWSINTDEMPPPSPYATVNGVNRYVLPNGGYVIATNMVTSAVGAGANQANGAKPPASKKIAAR